MKQRKFLIEVIIVDPDDETDSENLIGEALSTGNISSFRLHRETTKSPKQSRFQPPSESEVIEEAKLKGVLYPEVFAKKFISFYESKDWMIGKNKMKKWKAAVNTWILKDDNNGGKGKGVNQPIDKNGYTGALRF